MFGCCCPAETGQDYLPITAETYTPVKPGSRLTATQQTGHKTTTIKDATFAKFQPSAGTVTYGTGLPAPDINQPVQFTTIAAELSGHVRKGRELKYADLFPNAPCRLELDPNTPDIEGYYSNCLYQAKKRNLVEEQIFVLMKISDLYLQKNDFFKSAKILNCAIAIAQFHPQVKTCLFSRLKSIEDFFLTAHRIRTSPERAQTTEKYRNSLQRSRLAAETSKEAIQEILSALTQAFQDILRDLIAESIHILGPPPAKWAAIGMGSMSRGEMCPYSDIEFAFLLEQETQDAMEYFRTLSKILELKVIFLGETPFPVFGWEYPSPTPDGFCMDSAGNTPLGVQNLYELIGTPTHLAQFQSFKWIRDSIILPNVMSNVCLISGDPKLFSTYTQAKQKVQSQLAKKESKNGEELAYRLIAGHLHEFHPNLSQQKEEETAFNVKKELYRPLQEILSSLAILYQLKTQTSFDRINELQQLGVFSTTGAKNLRKALAKVLMLRLHVHLFYKNEKEFLCHAKPGISQDPTLLYMKDEHIELLHEIYQVLIPFHRCIEGFHQTKDKKSLNEGDFFDDSPSTRGIAFVKAFQYSKAHEAYQAGVSLNPNDFDTQSSLGNIEFKMGKYEEALQRYLKALKLTQQKYGENHLSVATSYGNIGVIYTELDENAKALECLQKALEIKLTLQGENHPDLYVCYGNIGSHYVSLEEYDKALEFCQKALKILIAELGEDHLDPDMATTYSNIGVIYTKLDENAKALECLQKALKIWLSLFGENHPDAAPSYNSMGLVHHNLKEYDKALECYQKAWKIMISILGENHPDVAVTYSNFGTLYSDLEQHTQALEYHQKALQIYHSGHGENHPNTAQGYYNVGLAYEKLEEYTKALAYFQKALKSQLATGGKNHPTAATIYGKIGLIYNNLGEQTMGFKYFQKCLKVRVFLLGENHPDAGELYGQIALLYVTLEKPAKALGYYQKAIKLQLTTLGTGLVSSYEAVGRIHESLGEHEKALEYRQKALEIQQESTPPDTNNHNLILMPDNMNEPGAMLGVLQDALKIQISALGESHPSVAKSYAAIGNIYYTLGELVNALEYCQRALRIRLATLAEDHLDIGESYGDLGDVYEGLGESTSALEYYHQALMIQLSALGENHPNLAPRYRDISDIYYNRNENIKALEYRQKALNIELLVLGNKHPDVATSYDQIGAIHYRLENYEMAIEFFQNALTIVLLEEDGNSTQVATRFYNIANCYINRGSDLKALENYQKSLQIALSVLGENHPDLANQYDNIGYIYEKMGEYAKALEHYQKLLGIHLSVLGEDHLDIASDYSNIGFMYSCLKDLTKALENYQKALAIRQNLLGKSHPDVAKTSLPIGIFYYKMNKPLIALTFFEEALKIWLLAYGEDHPNIESVLANLVACIHKSSLTVHCLQEIIALCSQILGNGHPVTQQLTELLQLIPKF